MIHRIKFLSLLSIFLVNVAMANFSASVDRKKISEGEVFQLTLSIDTNTTTRPDWSILQKSFDILGTSQSSNVQYINGNMSVSKSWILSLLPKNKGKVIVPAIHFGKETSQPIEIEIVAASDLKEVNNNDVSITATLSGDSHYVFQAIPLTVRIETKLPFSQAELRAPLLKGAELKQQGEDKQSQEVRNGIRVNVIERQYTINTQEKNTIEIPPFILQGNFISGESMQRGFPSMFDRPGKPFIVKTDSMKVEVKANPNQDSEWFLPATSVEIFAKWPSEIPVFKKGEPIIRQISLIAVGAQPEQLPKLTIPEILGLKIYVDSDKTDKVKQANKDVARRMVSLSIVPEHGGEFTLPELSVKWLNTETGKPEVAKLKSEIIKVIGEPSKKNTQNNEERIASKSAQEILGEDKNEQPTATSQNNWTWLNVLLGFFVGGISVWAWQRFLKKDDLESLKLEGIQKDIDMAITSGDKKHLYSALLAWKNHGIKFTHIFEKHYLTLERSIYQSDTELDLETFKDVLKKERSKNKVKKPKNKVALPELYKR